MKVLFVSSGNLRLKQNPIIINQAKSLEKHHNIRVYHYFIKGKGILGYLKNIPKLRKAIKSYKPDLIHAHYSFAGIISALSTNKPIITSLMGSDINKPHFIIAIIKIFSLYVWSCTIVKSEYMKKRINLPKAHVIPNGVDMDFFRPIENCCAQKKVNFAKNEKNILFIGDPARYEKNVELAYKACNLLEKEVKAKISIVYNTDHKLIPYYLNASDVLLLTSRWEGSPNVIKEAMACNIPIVSTDVGDVKENIRNCNGCFIVDYDPMNIAESLKSALKTNKRTNGRELISHLKSELIANKVVDVYSHIINKK